MRSEAQEINRTECMHEKIEILGLDIFNSQKKEIAFIERMKECLGKEIGWHYLLDLAWMMKEIGCLNKGSLILDAGGGNGVAQFILAEMGYNVVNADFANPVFSKRVIERYGETMLHLNNPGDVTFDNRYTRHLSTAHNIPIESAVAEVTVSYPEDKNEAGALIQRRRYRPPDCSQAYNNGALPYILKNNVAEKCGRIYLYKCDLRDMSLLPDGLFDGIISISALEHNDHEDFQQCVNELLRITRKGGKLAITVSASAGDDWFHEESQGWCYSEGSLKKLFNLQYDVPSNYLQVNRIFNEMSIPDNELHRRLASFHFRSGKNGMPWGIWKPQYLPVGIVRYKE